ncbi:hypothetical protein CAP36_14100 [Chitinophagaceae bacterium IBVUCB2]|nr:hypothetical protein CAP36_14100 [Chitinophagaceae bacterium IBVUCB2]
MSKKIFLSARWEYLAMFNYEVDPQILQKHVPPGTAIDYFDGKALVSIVGFLFNNTKVLGVRWPFHVNFEEANLRYYIKRLDGAQWKRGVGFVSEIVPKSLIATMANLFYNEHYSTAKMTHQVIETTDNLFVEYSWQKRNQNRNVIRVNAKPELQEIKMGSAEEFIFEHYFGYNQLTATSTIEYAVAHPRWEIYPVTSFSLDCDIERLYGKEFVPYISNREPHSVFLAKGSDVTVKMPVKIRGI